MPPKKDNDDEISKQIIKFIKSQNKQLQDHTEIEQFITKLITHEANKSDNRAKSIIISDFLTVYKAL